MDPIPEAVHRIDCHTTKRCVQSASTAMASITLAIALMLNLPFTAKAQDSTGATSLGSGLGGSLSDAAPIGSGFGLGSGVMQNAALGSGLINLRDLVDSPIMQKTGRAFDYFASLGVFAGYTDNTALAGFGGTAVNGRGSTFERITPSLGATFDFNRIQGSANYTPSFYFYNSDTAANQSSHSLSGQLLFTMVPNALFVRTSAYGTVASSSQLSTYNGVSTALTNNSTQVYSYNISPYFTHSFADVATIYTSYNFSESFFQQLGKNRNSSKTTLPLTAQNLTSPGVSNSATQSESATLSSGPAFTFLQHVLSVQAAQFYGQNLHNTGDSKSLSYTLNYAYSRFLAIFGQVGYQTLHYNATAVNGIRTSKAYTYNGLTGSGGVRLTPNDLSELTLSYGFYDGGNVITASGRVQPTPRITFLANSSSSVTTNGQDLSNYAATSNFSANGATSIPVSGTPTNYTLGNSVYNPAPFRSTRSSVSVVYSRDRDTFSANVGYNEQTAVAAVSNSSSGSSHSVLASVGWQHTVSDTVFLSTTGNYGSQYSASSGSGHSSSNPVFGAVARLSNTLSPTLSAEIDYIFQHQQYYAGPLQTNKVETMNEIYAGLTKQF